MKKLIIFLATFLFAQSITETNLTFEENNLSIKPQIVEITLQEPIKPLQPNIKLAILIDKPKFFKFIPSIINSINAYFITKEINYELKVLDIEANISQLKQNGFNDFIVYSLDKNYIKNLQNYDANFYIPVFNKNDIETNATNLYFSGINYKNQIAEFIKYMDTNKAIAINDSKYISQKLTNIEKELNLSLEIYKYPNINYYKLSNNFIFLNVGAGKSAQVLSNITSKEINTKLIFAPQIDYDPLLIEITQPQDVKKLIISNSLIKIPKDIEDINLNLNSDIQYNWLNYATSVLLNKLYNKKTQNDEFYINDFNLYIFNNQVNYKTKLYQIINGAFVPIE